MEGLAMNIATWGKARLAGNDWIGRGNDWIGRGNDWIGRGNDWIGRAH
jgi:hypothetical protein